jgi:hypothetical protein
MQDTTHSQHKYDEYYPLRVHRRFGGTYYFYFQGRRVRKASRQEEIGGKQLELVCFSETPVNYQNRRRHIPGGSTLFGLYTIMK